MRLSRGVRLGPYEVVALLGAGGMGEVYRARDTKLDRHVALKILPASFADDPDRLMRFEREAKTLASLNHPHIAQVHGFEQSQGVSALVMELVEGEDLATRLERGPIPIDEAVPIARQIAEALEAAHEAGIIHRDLKPANIKVRGDGTVKVLDFGLAKAEPPTSPAAGRDASPDQHSPTFPAITSPAITQAGMLLGTAAYMAPEQVKGKPVDRRADIWAFGALLFEMLTGQRAFRGDDVAETIASVLRAEPAWQLLPVDTPDALRVLIRQCLEKDPQRRPSHLSVARFVLNAGAEMDRGAAALAGARRSQPQRQPVAASMFAALIVGAALASAFTWWSMRDGRATVTRIAPIRFTVAAETGGETWRTSTDRPFVLSPDGRAVAYRGHVDNQPKFFIRDLENIDPRLLIDGRLIRAPFFSPDGQWLGFFDGRELRKIRTTGGPAVTICQVSHEIVLGASWGDDDSIVFAVSQPTSTTPFAGLMVVAASGGEPTVLTTVDPKSGEGAHVQPHVLPRSRGGLYTVRMRGRPQSEGRLVVLDRASGERREIVAGGSAGQYVDGRVVYTDGQGLLQSLAFDVSQLRPTGPASALGERVYVPAVGVPLFSIASSGALAFVPAVAGPTPETVRTVVWVDRRGRETPIPLPPRAYAVARLAPDGTRIALDIRDGGNDIWIWSIARGVLTRLTSVPTLDFGPIWSPDSRRIIWSSTRSNPNPTLHWQAADGTGAPELLGIEGPAVYPGSVTPDGQDLIFSGAANIIQRVDLASGDRIDTVLAGSSLVATPEVSPDGRWLAYQSSESGEPEIYVRPYPNVEAGRWQISTQGGTRPAWRRDGRELFFLDGQERLSSASIEVKGETLVPGAVQRVLETAYYPGFTTRGFNLRGYDVSPDGQRFLMIKRSEDDAGFTSEMTIVLHWSPVPR